VGLNARSVLSASWQPVCVSRVLLEKSSGARVVFVLTVSERAVVLRYGLPSGPALLAVSFRTQGRLSLHRWTHLVLQVRASKDSGDYITSTAVWNSVRLKLIISSISEMLCVLTIALTGWIYRVQWEWLQMNRNRRETKRCPLSLARMALHLWASKWWMANCFLSRSL